MRVELKAAALFALALAAPLTVMAADGAAGRWKTIDDKTGQAKSIVEISQASDGSLTGKVAEILTLEKGPNPVCEGCSGELKNKPIKGMKILWDLKPSGANAWTSGTIMDPSNGKTYKSKATLEPDGKKLDVSGCILGGIICRAQTWIRE